MIGRLMRQVRKIRPWMVAVALACGGASVYLACDTGSGDCEPRAYYGPAVCTSDDQCIAALGPGAYCETEPTVYDDGCGNEIVWGRICAGGGSADADADADTDVLPDTVADDGATDCIPAGYYGPAPCVDDAECEAEYGPGWTCTGYDTYPDGCGDTATWGPFCENTGGADADADATDDVPTWYGPPPTDGGTDVVDDVPTTFYGPPPVDAGFDDAASNLYGPPPPDDASDDVPAAFYGPTPVDGG